MAAVLAVGELPVSSLAAAPGKQPVSVSMFNMMHYARQTEAFATGLLMMLAGGLAVFITFKMSGRLWNRYRPEA